MKSYWLSWSDRVTGRLNVWSCNVWLTSECSVCGWSCRLQVCSSPPAAGLPSDIHWYCSVERPPINNNVQIDEMRLGRAASPCTPAWTASPASHRRRSRSSPPNSYRGILSVQILYKYFYHCNKIVYNKFQEADKKNIHCFGILSGELSNGVSSISGTGDWPDK